MRPFYTRPMVVTALISAGAAHSQPAAAYAQFDPTFGADISVGAEYDSNISVNEIDANTGADDFAAVIDADFEFESEIAADTDLSLGYSFSQSLHADFTAFDVQSHFASAELSHDFGALDIGAAYRFIYTRLGGNGFLAMQQFSPYLSRFFGKKFFVRADYTYTDKNFQNRTDRDATVHAGGADLYFFLNGVKSYFVTGYKFEDEDAVDPQFDYRSHNIKVRYAQRIPVGEREAKLKLGWRYETRDYASVTPSIGAVRDDDRHRFQAELEVPLTDRLYTLLEYEYANFTSNLASADYTQNLAGARFGVRF